MSRERRRRRGLVAVPVRGHRDVAGYFDACAATYAEQHGDAERLLRYRLSLLRAAACFGPRDAVLEIGCGDGLHLLALGGEIGSGVGVDLSPAMIAAARRRLRAGPWEGKLRFRVDVAERLATLADESVDVALCVGALEHLLDPGAALRSVYRVLRRGGRCVVLTVNGGSLWYRYLAPALGIEMRRLATDRYPTRRELERLVAGAGFEAVELGGWSFVQRGDLPPPIAAALQVLDRIGRRLSLGAFRGGLSVRASKV